MPSTICLAEDGDDAIAPYADALIRLPQVPVLLQPLVAVVPLQLFACELATAAGPRRRPAAQPRQVGHGRMSTVAVIGVGIDVVDIERFVASLERTPACASGSSPPPRRVRPPASLAARFAAKEALAKALGAPVGMDWHDAEVVSEESGRPVLDAPRHRPRAGRPARRRLVHLSLSHDAGIASAVVVLES